jgi:EpsI family protein
LVVSLIATIAGQFLGTGAEQELVAAAPIEQIPMRLGRWKGTDVPVPEEVKEMLTADAIVHREYRDLGYEVTLWILYWSSRNMVKGYHHPDVCWRNRGFRQESREMVPIAAGGGTIPLTVREFARDSGGRSHRQLILYWTQEGRRVWSEEDERRVQAAGDSHDWLGERLFRREPLAATGRIVVLIGTPVWADGKAIREQTFDLAAKLAEEVYRVCPWAAPPGN